MPSFRNVCGLTFGFKSCFCPSCLYPWPLWTSAAQVSSKHPITLCMAGDHVHMDLQSCQGRHNDNPSCCCQQHFPLTHACHCSSAPVHMVFLCSEDSQIPKRLSATGPCPGPQPLSLARTEVSQSSSRENRKGRANFPGTSLFLI